MSTESVHPIAPVAPSAAATAIDQQLKERQRAAAQQWLDALPVRIALRPRSAAGPARLVMYRVAANTQEFWEKTWTVSPCFRMRGYTLPRWYKDIFTRRLPREGLIVEAGCGNGNLVRMLLNEGILGERGRVEGLDFAPDVIAQNRRVHPTEGPTAAKGTYLVGDVRALPYPNDSIAAYISMGVVEHFDEAERARILAEAARCLQPRGTAIITVPYFSPARRIRAALGTFADDIQSNDGAAFYQFYFTAKEICQQIERAGLRVVELDGYDCRRGWSDAFGPTAERAAAWLAKQGPRAASWVEQPSKLIRRFCPHMLMLVAQKPNRGEATQGSL